MKDSKTLKSFIRFVVKVALIGLMAFGVWKFIFWYFWEYDRGPEAYASSYQRALLRQIYALEDEDRDPEIIVFGSSYVPFGVDTKTLETAVGDGRKAQILGIEAAIGVPYLIHVLEETAKPGDTVVYMLGESNPVNTDLISVSAALEPDKEKLFAFWKWRDGSLPKSYLTWRKFYAFIVSPVSNKLLEKFSKKQPVYNISSFDENGNMTVERIGSEMSFNESHNDVIKIDEVEEGSIEALNEFEKWCAENDVEFLITYSPTVEESWQQSDEMFKSFDADVEAAVNAPVLGGFEDYTLPAKYFFNHDLHLNSEGAVKYSEILGERLKEYYGQRSL